MVNMAFVNLYDSSGDDASPARLASNTRNSVICIDCNDDKEPQNDSISIHQKKIARPLQQEVIEIDDSEGGRNKPIEILDDDSSVDNDVPRAVQPVVARKSLPATEDSSDSDSSDDERDLQRHMRQQEQEGVSRQRSTISVPASVCIPQPTSSSLPEQRVVLPLQHGTSNGPTRVNQGQGSHSLSSRKPSSIANKETNHVYPSRQCPPSKSRKVPNPKTQSPAKKPSPASHQGNPHSGVPVCHRRAQVSGLFERNRMNAPSFEKRGDSAVRLHRTNESIRDKGATSLPLKRSANIRNDAPSLSSRPAFQAVKRPATGGNKNGTLFSNTKSLNKGTKMLQSSQPNQSTLRNTSSLWHNSFGAVNKGDQILRPRKELSGNCSLPNGGQSNSAGKIVQQRLDRLATGPRNGFPQKAPLSPRVSSTRNLFTSRGLPVAKKSKSKSPSFGSSRRVLQKTKRRPPPDCDLVALGGKKRSSILHERIRKLAVPKTSPPKTCALQSGPVSMLKRKSPPSQTRDKEFSTIARNKPASASNLFGLSASLTEAKKRTNDAHCADLSPKPNDETRDGSDSFRTTTAGLRRSMNPDGKVDVSHEQSTSSANVKSKPPVDENNPSSSAVPSADKETLVEKEKLRPCLESSLKYSPIVELQSASSVRDAVALEPVLHGDQKSTSSGRESSSDLEDQDCSLDPLLEEEPPLPSPQLAAGKKESPLANSQSHTSVPDSLACEPPRDSMNCHASSDLENHDSCALPSLQGKKALLPPPELEVPGKGSPRTNSPSGTSVQDSVSSGVEASSSSSGSDCYGATSTNKGLEPENIDYLRDSSFGGDDLKLWTRKSRKRVSYKEPETPELSPSPPKRHKGVQPSEIGQAEDLGAKVVPRSSSRKRRSPVWGTSDSSLTQDTLDEEEDMKGYIPHIEPLSKYTYDEAGMPTFEFSLLEPDDTIHDLKVVVRQSGIPNSGMGAFLTYRGARVLKDEVRDVAAEQRDSSVLNELDMFDTTMPVDAIMPGGFGATVKLTGESLRGNQNLSSAPSATVPLEARAPSGRKIKVNLSGGHCKCSKDEDEPVLGNLGVHTKKDFIAHPDILLTSCDFSIDLGRYGPVLRKDRKPQSHYDVKNFIFDHAPAEYGMDVSEKIGGCTQVIDITDDATGTRHEEALRLPMSYVNEIGHNSKLKANVHLKEKDGRSVHYFLALAKPLRRGETVELLADYDATYEDVRERKGYGKANINDGVMSDSHEPTALMRHFDDRQLMADQVDGLSIVDLFHMMEFIIENILDPIESRIEQLLNGGNGGNGSPQKKPTCLQWMGRLRIHWLGGLFLARVDALVQDLPQDLPACFPPYRKLLEQAKVWGNQMRWRRLGQCVGTLAKHDADAFTAFQVALREDILYRLSKKVVKPLDESMWCKTAVALTKELCDDTMAASSLELPDVARDQLLLHLYLEKAKQAGHRIRTACRDLNDHNLDSMAFFSHVKKDEVINETSLTSFKGFEENDFFRKNTTCRKGILASLLALQSQRDALELASLSQEVDLTVVPIGTTHRVLMVAGGDSKTDVVGYPQHADSVGQVGHTVHEDWYLAWQVAYVVDCFAKEFLVDSESRYSLERLCDHVGIDREKAKTAIDLGIETKEYDVCFVSKEGKTPRKSKSRSARGAPRKRAQAPKQTRRPVINRALFEKVIWKTLVELGWTLDMGNRPTDFYFLPKGVERRRGFSNRKDYFDSTKLVMNFIKTDTRWKDLPQVVEAVALFEKLTALKDKLKLPKNIGVEELIGKLEASES